MKNSEDKGQESTEETLIEDICQLKRIALGEGAVACQVCGTPLSGGSPVSVYAYRPAGESTFEIGHLICGDDGHDLTTHFTLGVRELLIEGRVGLCSDVATGACWPVLLDPSVRVVSTMESREGRIVPETPTDDVPWVYGDALLERATDDETASGSDSESRNNPTKPTVADGMGHTNKNTSPTSGETTNTTNHKLNPDSNRNRDGNGDRDEGGNGDGGEC